MTASGSQSREFGGFFSSARNFALLPGTAIEPGSVGGYYIDFKLKARLPGWPPAWLDAERGSVLVNVAQWGLGAYERYLAGEGEQWLAWARDAAEHLLARQRDDGAFPHLERYRHTFKLEPPWLSAMAQGQAASLLVRLLRQEPSDRYQEAALRALAPFDVPSSAGGIRAELGHGWFPEEYPTQPPSYVLNGGVFALYGLYDVWRGLGDEEAGRRFHETLDTLAANADRWDTGYWSRYDLHPHPVPNVASSAYHLLHISQLESLERLESRPGTAAVLERFRGYQDSAIARRRAFAAKSLFRLVVPRNAAVARRLPWSPFFRT